jgi:hypothetical protein
MSPLSISATSTDSKGGRKFTASSIAIGATRAAATGQLPSAATTRGAVDSPLNQPQAAMAVGQPVPVVFCRRRGTVGGVMISPLATMARFENTSTTVTSYYHTVLGEGQMGSVQVRDFRIGACRRGSFSQNYNQRAGTWVPGNFATTAGVTFTLPTFPTFTGGGGAYQGVTTLEFGSTVTGGSDDWNLGANVFIRDGRILERGRLLDAVVGASDNIADLVLLALERSSRVPATMIDLDSFTAAARFAEANGFWFNGEIKEPTNLGDWISRILPLFLLRQTRVGGKLALRPLLPTNADGTIKTTLISADWLLSETIIKPESFQRTWNDASTVPQYQATWRQQESDTDPPLARTVTVGEDGPQEQLDMAPFCTTELHAARAAHYQWALRTLSTHTASVTLRPGTQTGNMVEGQIVQIQYPITTPRETGLFNEWYQIESIGYSVSGEEVLSLIHFPVNRAGQSLLALAVANATVEGAILPTNQTGGTCDIFERDTDTSVPGSSSTAGSDAFSRPEKDGGKGEGFDKSRPTDRSPEAQPPKNGGGERAKGAADRGDPRCPLGYNSVSFTLISWYTTGGATAVTSTVTVSNAKSWPRLGFSNLFTDISPWRQHSFTVQYEDVNNVTQSISGTYLTPIISGFSTYLYELKTNGHTCEGSPANTDPVWYVRPGDTLYDIADKIYGDPTRWPEIYDANRDEIGEDPNLIFPGQWLKVPL